MILLDILQTLSMNLNQFSDALINLGYLGIFIATLLSSSFLPFPSSVIFIFGLTEANLNPLLCIICATAGNTCGSLILFSLGRLGKLRWLCTYGRIKPVKVRRFVKKAQKWGPPLACLTFIPGFGQAVIVALGLLRCDFFKTAVFTMLGKCIRYVIIALITLGIINWI